MVEGFSRKTEESIKQFSILALEYYLKHKQVVFRKLRHAQAATEQSILLMEQHGNAGANKSSAGQSEYLDKIKQFKKMWDEILDSFEGALIVEEDLCKVEELLSALSGVTKKIYEDFVKKDSVLQKLIKEIHADKYRQALKVVSKVQGGADPMSGLSGKEFDFEKDAGIGVYQSI